MAGAGSVTIVNTLPTPGTSTSWGTTLNTVINEIIDGLEAKVTPAGITIDADLDMNQYDVTDLDSCRFTSQSAKTAAGDTRKLYAVSGELYFTDDSQNAVAITGSGNLSTVHTDRVILIPASAGMGSVDGAFVANAGGYVDCTASAILHIPLPLIVGDRLKTIKLYYNTSDACTCLIEKSTCDGTNAVVSVAVDESTVVATSAAADANFTFTVTTPVVTALTEFLYFSWNSTNAANELWGIEVTYDHP